MGKEKEKENTSFYDWEQSLKPNKKSEKNLDLPEDQYKKIIKKFKESLPDDI